MADCPDDDCYLCTGKLVCLDCGEDLATPTESEAP